MKKGESREVRFVITAEELKFYNNDLIQVVELGEFKLYIGTSSINVKEADFKVIR